jgi:hypothetical protein
MITKSTNLDALASKYATLKHQIDGLKVQFESVRDELLLEMHPGDKIENPEYNVTCYAGKSSVIWTKAGEAHKKEFQNTLISQGLMDIKIGDPFVQVRFVKQAEAE